MQLVLETASVQYLGLTQFYLHAVTDGRSAVLNSLVVLFGFNSSLAR